VDFQPLKPKLSLSNQACKTGSVRWLLGSLGARYCFELNLILPWVYPQFHD